MAEINRENIVNFLIDASEKMNKKSFSWTERHEKAILRSFLYLRDNQISDKEKELVSQIDNYICTRVINYEEVFDRVLNCAIASENDVCKVINYGLKELLLLKQIYFIYENEDEFMSKYFIKEVEQMELKIKKSLLTCSPNLQAGDLLIFFEGNSRNNSCNNYEKYLKDINFPFTREELKASRNNLAKKYHPDNDGSKDDMKAINELYNKLKDFCVEYENDDYEM